MPRMTESERSFRRELTQHLWHMHGEFRNTMDLTTDELDSIHKMFHVDGYDCPPHEHRSADGGYELGKVKLKYGKKYIDKAVGALRGEF